MDVQPLQGRLAEVAALQNGRKYEALKTQFTRNATVQSPITPRGVSVDAYIRALQADPCSISFSNTQAVYSLPGSIVTQSDVACSQPDRFSLRDRATVHWKMEDGYWRISRIYFSDWPIIYGTWRRGGLKDEDSIELRIVPGGNYFVYLGEDYSAPAFKGHYRIVSNTITLADTSADDPKLFQSGEGTYNFARSGAGITLTKIEDANNWRSDRFDGAWMGVH